MMKNTSLLLKQTDFTLLNMKKYLSLFKELKEGEFIRNQVGPTIFNSTLPKLTAKIISLVSRLSPGQMTIIKHSKNVWNNTIRWQSQYLAFIKIKACWFRSMRQSKWMKYKVRFRMVWQPWQNYEMNYMIEYRIGTNDNCEK